jgi:phospho-N-acetylmuramoyl-pentapeptide-transferase
VIYLLLSSLSEQVPIFNVFRYITFRALMAAMLALMIAFVFGPVLLRVLRAGQVGQPVSEFAPRSHAVKQGTPTMGGVLILASLLLAVLAFADLTNPYVLLTSGVLVGYGLVGAYDDYQKVTVGKNAGLSARVKLAWQFGIALAAISLLYGFVGYDTTLSVPFFKNLRPDLGWFYVPFATCVVVGTSNAVNLTDGLDGLAIGPVMTTAATCGILTYVAGHSRLASYLFVTPVPGAGELAIVCAAMATASLGFLWFNTYPAQMFMGDVGALALGGGLGMIAVIAKTELLLVIAGGVFVVEALSVMIQLGSIKLRGKRVFRMAPIHHHFELAGWPEPLIIVRFWIISVLCALVALATLRLR